MWSAELVGLVKQFRDKMGNKNCFCIHFFCSEDIFQFQPDFIFESFFFGQALFLAKNRCFLVTRSSHACVTRVGAHHCSRSWQKIADKTLPAKICAEMVAGGDLHGRSWHAWCTSSGQRAAMRSNAQQCAAMRSRFDNALLLRGALIELRPRSTLRESIASMLHRSECGNSQS